MKILDRYERGNQFLDIVQYFQRSLDEDGFLQTDTCYECVVWENEKDYDKHTIYEFPTLVGCLLFAKCNGWTKQVL